MMTITANTKIGAILKEHPAALEAIVSISPKFEKLRNPVLRKLMAGRASIAMASKIAGCSANDFFAKLRPLGFESAFVEKAEVKPETDEVPAFLQNIRPEQLVKLDVRPVIAAGKDPLKLILEKVSQLKKGEVLEIINTFEPTPLMLLLKKQGFDSCAEEIRDGLVQTYFYRTADAATTVPADPGDKSAGWEEMLQKYKGNMETIDVRRLEMPGPMMKILETLDQLPADKALFVYHKRIPVYLIPELSDRKLDYRIREISEGEVELLIFPS